MSRELTQRNKTIYEKIKAGYTEQELMREYHFKSRKSLWVIKKRYEAEESEDGD